MRIFSTLVLLLSGIYLQAQTIKNIKELSSLEVECPLDIVSQDFYSPPVEENQVDKVIEKEEFTDKPSANQPADKDTPPIVLYPEAEKSIAQLASYLKSNKLHPTIEMQDFILLHKEDKLWRIENLDSTRSDPKLAFDFVKPAESNQVFIGTESNTLAFNLYSKSGEKILADDYDYIFEEETKEFFYVIKNGRYGVVNQNGAVVITPKYDEIKSLDDKYFLLKNGNFEGVAGRDGSFEITPAYKNLKPIVSDDGIFWFAATSESNHLILVNTEGKARKYGITVSQKSYKISISQGRYLNVDYRLADLERQVYLFCNQTRKMRINTVKSTPFLYKSRLFGRNYCFNANGEVEERLTGKSFYAFKNGITSINGKTESGKYLYGLLRQDMEWAAPLTYTSLITFMNTSFHVGTDILGNKGVVNNENQIVVHFEYKKIVLAGTNFIVYREENSEDFEVLDKAGNKVTSGKGAYEQFYVYPGFYIAVGKTFDNGVILNKDFEKIYTEKFTDIVSTTTDFALIEKAKNSFCTINQKGEPYLFTTTNGKVSEFVRFYQFSDTPHYFFQLADETSYLYNTDTKKTIALSPEIHRAYKFPRQKLKLFITRDKMGKREGLMNQKGENIVSPVNSQLDYDGKFIRLMGKRVYQYYSVYGENLFPECRDVRHIGDHYFALKKGGKWGVLTLQGQKVLPFDFKNIFVLKNGKFSVMNSDGSKSFIPVGQTK